MACLVIMWMEEVRRRLWCKGGRSIDQASRVLDNVLSCVRNRNCRTSSRRCGYERDLAQLGPVVRLGHVWGGGRRASRIGPCRRPGSHRSRGPLRGAPRDNQGRGRAWEKVYHSFVKIRSWLGYGLDGDRITNRSSQRADRMGRTASQCSWPKPHPKRTV